MGSDDSGRHERHARRERRRADLEDALEAYALATARVTVELIRRDEATEETMEEMDHAVTLLAGALLGEREEERL